MRRLLVEKDSYHDSVFLMLISSEVRKLDGVREAVVSMGTASNLQLLRGIGFSDEGLSSATPNDLLIAVEAADEDSAGRALARARELLAERKERGAAEAGYRPVSLDGALRLLPGANLLIVSVPGRYAAREARLALERGLHVMLFSDNVGLEEEVALKKLAVRRGLLLMGPDCGTAIINGRPLCFANVVRRGRIGIVAASGTGLQEVSCLIHRLGEGVSQAIGTGGRDLSPQVGGATTLMGIEALQGDSGTGVIVVLSKPPAPEVVGKVLKRLEGGAKPSVVHFLGVEARATEGPVHYAANLEEAAALAVSLLRGGPHRPHALGLPERELERLVEQEVSGMALSQAYLRGLFTGGTLADEALTLLQRELGGIYSNNQERPELRLPDPRRSTKHTVVDLGEDVFTVGRPHPMIDPESRVERIRQEAQDPEVAVMLLDCVLGYGSHPDPAGALVPSLQAARRRARERGGHLALVASVTGTEGDYQGLEEQRDKLHSAGCLLMPSNYQASLLALRILKRIASRAAKEP